MRDVYKSYDGEEFDTIDEWFDSLDAGRQYNVIMEYDDSLLIYDMETLDDAFTEGFREMTAREIIDYVDTHFRDFDLTCAFWGENTYGRLVADDDVLYLAECCGLDTDAFWKWAEDNFDSIVIE